MPSYASYTGQCRGEDSSSSGGESADDEDSSSSSSSSSGESEDEEDGGGVEVGGGQEPDGRSEGGQSSMGGGGSAGGGSAGDAEDCVMDWATGLYRISPGERQGQPKHCIAPRVPAVWAMCVSWPLRPQWPSAALWMRPWRPRASPS